MPLDLSVEEKNIVTEILHTHLPTATVWVFGSRAQGTARPTSDLDLLVMDAQPLSFATLAELKLAFSESFLPFRVDIVDGHAITQEFIDAISPYRQLIQEGQRKEA